MNRGALSDWWRLRGAKRSLKEAIARREGIARREAIARRRLLLLLLLPPRTPPRAAAPTRSHDGRRGARRSLLLRLPDARRRALRRRSVSRDGARQRRRSRTRSASARRRRRRLRRLRARSRAARDRRARPSDAARDPSDRPCASSSEWPKQRRRACPHIYTSFVCVVATAVESSARQSAQPQRERASSDESCFFSRAVPPSASLCLSVSLSLCLSVSLSSNCAWVRNIGERQREPSAPSLRTKKRVGLTSSSGTTLRTCDNIGTRQREPSVFVAKRNVLSLPR